jgi:hypothetical protein
MYHMKGERAGFCHPLVHALFMHQAFQSIESKPKTLEFCTFLKLFFFSFLPCSEQYAWLLSVFFFFLFFTFFWVFYRCLHPYAWQELPKHTHTHTHTHTHRPLLLCFFHFMCFSQWPLPATMQPTPFALLGTEPMIKHEYFLVAQIGEN